MLATRDTRMTEFSVSQIEERNLKRRLPISRTNFSTCIMVWDIVPNAGRIEYEGVHFCCIHFETHGNRAIPLSRVSRSLDPLWHLIRLGAGYLWTYAVWFALFPYYWDWANAARSYGVDDTVALKTPHSPAKRSLKTSLAPSIWELACSWSCSGLRLHHLRTSKPS